MKLLRVILPIAFLCSASALLAEAGPSEIHWDDMRGKFEFEDPFVRLSQGQIYRLAVVARVRELDAKGHQVDDAMREEAKEAEGLLAEEKVDVDGLLEKRNEIKNMRKQRAEMPVEALDGKLVKLAGFVLPLEYEGKKVKEFLLVPWVGACIHTPPPPANQIAHVEVLEAFESKGTFEAVTVTGTIHLEKKESELFLVDGKAMISMSYVFKEASVEKYKRP